MTNSHWNGITSHWIPGSCSPAIRVRVRVRVRVKVKVRVRVRITDRVGFQALVALLLHPSLSIA